MYVHSSRIFEKWHRRLGRNYPSVLNRSRTYDILATSTKLQETRGSEGHKTSSLRNSRLEVMGARKNGRARDTRGERERLPNRPMEIVSRRLSSLRSRRLEGTSKHLLQAKKRSLRSMAVLSGALLSGEAAKTRAKRACLYYFEHPTSPTVSESGTG